MVLFLLNYSKFLAVRNIEAAQKSVEAFITKTELKKKIIYLNCDISDMKSIKIFAQNVQEKYPKINLLINNGNLRIKIKF